jgi:hypothetical protein
MRQDEKTLLAKISAAHGLNKITSIRQELAMEVKMMLLKGPSMGLKLLFDFKNHRGRVEMYEKGKLQQIYQESDGECVFWSAKNGKVTLGAAKKPFDFVPQMQTGLIGLIALGTTRDPVQVGSERRGSVLTRAQGAHRMPLMQGRGEPTIETVESVLSYVIGPDGTLLSERIVQTAGSKKVQQELSYGRFQTIGGVKVPTEMGVKNDQLPRMASVKMKVRKTEINPALSAADFKLP